MAQQLQQNASKYAHLVHLVDKPPNMLTVDGNDPTVPSVQQLLRGICPDSRIVHRLDYETSGLLVIALTKTAAQHLNAQFRARTVRKTYIARVAGHVAEDQGHIKVRMAPHATRKLLQCVLPEGDGGEVQGRESETLWRVLERSDASGGDDPPVPLSTLMELRPVTGKTHQLRVHMQWLGHPIVGDSLYYATSGEQDGDLLCLHAAALALEHPVSGDQLHWKSTVRRF